MWGENCQVELEIQMKHFRNKDKQTFSDKQELGEDNALRPALQKILKKCL